ncbi:hypothetical protein A3H89_04385 [Candidatus Amesbacteria bacterium RIFCSPLOWO2_02_FULL_48_11]|uniref:Uncharacterized protein n=1 Tax=Candidatus Amesbacteria bacterium RIFOXYD1_FULL_47_9 TaxID=1797267 RepID=A0A1F5A2Q0_9BACT|nr:MAG: hypothetical protein A2354_00830 [Candidatus Amesbacteria bacterium RIFOXYB1_FULL_47_12]OGD06514.1 MAG: hypothetical protein A3H89_04385 [Candidatus Amesbacteria bacterium RIFCSPLOWO2_02_FULL_48_11]OGD12872.1 MAG: hypothetical protein A2576_03720 [Candidatus Amesbacteria bacterium RIFOXYD1_FULL_47_9]
MGVDFNPSLPLCLRALKEGIGYYSQSPRCTPYYRQYPLLVISAVIALVLISLIPLIKALRKK